MACILNWKIPSGKYKKHAVTAQGKEKRPKFFGNGSYFYKATSQITEQWKLKLQAKYLEAAENLSVVAKLKLVYSVFKIVYN